MENIKIGKSIEATIDLKEHDIRVGYVLPNEALKRCYKVVGTASGGHYKCQITHMTLKELLSCLVNGHNDELVLSETFEKKYPDLFKLIQKTFGYFY